jgi:hypothetical protein
MVLPTPPAWVFHTAAAIQRFRTRGERKDAIELLLNLDGFQGWDQLACVLERTPRKYRQ